MPDPAACHAPPTLRLTRPLRLTTAGYRICAGRDLDKALWRDVAVTDVPNNYQRFIKSIRTGKQDQPDFARGAEIQKVLDACFVSDAEKRPVKV